MRDAIILPYVVDQNEPSRPLPEIFSIPDDEEEVKNMLFHLFVHYVNDSFEQDEMTYSIGGEDDFGDIVYGNEDNGCFLYVTFIKPIK